MDFTHGEDRRMLGDTLGRYIADRYGMEARNHAAYGEAGYSADHWRALADLGVVGALFDEAAGGFGGTGFDIMVVFEALGGGLVVEPFLGALMAGRALAAAGGHDAALARIVAGEAVAAFAHLEPQAHHDPDIVATTARVEGDGWRLDGAKAVVPHAEAADLLLVSARAGEELGLFLVEKGAGGLAVRGYGNVDGGRSGEVTLAGTPAARVGGEATGLIADTVDAGLLALSAEGLGVMESMKTATIEYLRTRQQFGVPIGKFQALQHRMATVLLEIEQARSAVINAADALGSEGGRRALAAAKYTIGRTGTLVAEEAIQLHGGIGMTWELPLSHQAKRLTMIGHQMGDEDHHLMRYVALGRAG